MTAYRDVLNSPRWRALKWRRILQTEFRCEGCGRAYHGRKPGAMRVFQLHHRHYSTVGNEDFADVQVLCRRCHASVHGIDEAAA